MQNCIALCRCCKICCIMVLKEQTPAVEPGNHFDLFLFSLAALHKLWSVWVVGPITTIVGSVGEETWLDYSQTPAHCSSFNKTNTIFMSTLSSVEVDHCRINCVRRAEKGSVKLLQLLSLLMGVIERKKRSRDSKKSRNWLRLLQKQKTNQIIFRLLFHRSTGPTFNSIIGQKSQIWRVIAQVGRLPGSVHI